MSDAEIALTAQPTALAAHLDSHELTTYRGVLTPRELDAPEAETAALVRGAAVHDLGWLKRIAVRGEDRFRWLSGMVTNTVNDLPPNAGAWNLVLNAQGRIQGDLTVWRDKDTLELEIAADQYERLIAHLDQFIIMDDVELVPLGGEVALGLTGPLADDVLGRLSLPTLAEPMTSVRVEWNGVDLRLVRAYGTLAVHYELWVPATQIPKLWKFVRTAGAMPVGCALLEAFRIGEGIPLYGVDIVERDLPQETSQTRALHFNKGCYLGQEIVERIRSRGSVHRHLRQLVLDGPVPAGGIELTAEDKPAGHITSAARLNLGYAERIFGLGVVRGEAEVRKTALSYTVGIEKGTAKVLDALPSLAN